MIDFVLIILDYFIDILPAMAVGFLLSGIIHEFVPSAWIEKTLGRGGVRPVFYAALTGTILPICCWGSLPVAVSFHKKGSSPGAVLAFLVATPATSVTALLVSFKLLGIKFMLFEFFAVILMGVVMGLIINRLLSSFPAPSEQACPHCCDTAIHTHKTFPARIKSVFKFAYWDMPRRIGLEMFVGIILAAAVAAIIPIGLWIERNLTGFFGYVFALLFGLIMYICSTATVPLVDAFIRQGLNIGAGMTLLLVGPITSYGTILVLRKEFGVKVLSVYLAFISTGSLVMGYLFSLM